MSVFELAGKAAFAAFHERRGRAAAEGHPETLAAARLMAARCPCGRGDADACVECLGHGSDLLLWRGAVYAWSESNVQYELVALEAELAGVVRDLAHAPAALAEAVTAEED